MSFPEKTSWMVYVAFVLALGPPVSLAQESESDSSLPIPDADEQEIDEIVVTGKKSLRQVRREIRMLDLQIYSMFNELNSDDDYDIVCRKMTRIGSQIVRNNCKAKLYWDALSELAEETDGWYIVPQPVPNPQKHTAVFRAKLAKLADENAALRKALVQRRNLAHEEKAILGDKDD